MAQDSVVFLSYMRQQCGNEGDETAVTDDRAQDQMKSIGVVVRSTLSSDWPSQE